MFVFPRKKLNPLLMDDIPPGLFAVYHESGWINKETFLVWFKKFIEHSNPGPKMSVMLIIDGHNSHTKSLELDNFAQANNVVLLCFPPHTTHRLQPLDVSFMALLSTFYEQTRKWLINHPGRCVTIYQVGKLFKVAFLRAATVQTAVKGFEIIGIYPLNRDVFPEYLFAPSETTEKLLDNTSELKIASRNENVKHQPSASSSKTMPTVEPQQLSVCLITKTWVCVSNFFVEHLPQRRPEVWHHGQLPGPRAAFDQPCSSTFNISPAVVMLFP
ncbi:hypothetical protein AVEN_260068-1 [Araneus ventricosus]|uniref:DDE-1 domain-containing protein n=1 Tax=Araneus ventricosus TaxID=182803 RepID=A0A4Y2G796_ARAVE|nr:hypothetical protein AVEN_260068-1 [Araneus ventricosus]